jgi:hypothetical protein
VLRDETWCDDLRRVVLDPDSPLEYDERFREFRIVETDGEVGQAIRFCPFCGTELPQNLRSEWFDRIWALGLEVEDTNIPERLLSEAWWRQEGL